MITPRELVAAYTERQAGSAHARSIALMKFLSRVAIRSNMGEHVYVVGGAVRNFILNVPIKDIDVVVDSVAAGKKRDSEWFAKKVQSAIPTTVNLTTNQYGVAILTVKGNWILDGEDMQGEVIEIANARKESYGGAEGKGFKPHMVEPATVEEDVVRREFTFNTLLWRMLDLAHGPDRAEILDLTGRGLKDLKDGVMATPKDPDIVFSDDPTRLLRAVKFVAKYDFKIPPDLAASIKRNAPKMKNAPWEAIGTILIENILAEPTARESLKMMKDLGLLDVIAEMIKESKPFQAYMSGKLRIHKVQVLMDLMDLGVSGIKTPITFLSMSQLERLRVLTVGWPSGQAESFLEVLTMPPIDTMAFITELKLEGKDRSLPQQAAREVLLADPDLANNPAGLQEATGRKLRIGRMASNVVAAVNLQAVGGHDPKFGRRLQEFLDFRPHWVTQPNGILEITPALTGQWDVVCNSAKNADVAYWKCERAGWSVALRNGQPDNEFTVLEPPLSKTSHMTRAAGTNAKVVEQPHNFHPVTVEEPKLVRKEFPFEGFIDFQGLLIDIENKKGSKREGTDPDGHPWSTEMFSHYGEIRGTEGSDGDLLDAYVGDNHDSGIVVVVHQHNPWDGQYDEDKVMLGYDSIEEAIGAYKKQYDKPGYFKADQFTVLPMGQFWRWVKDERNKGKRVKAAAAKKIDLDAMMWDFIGLYTERDAIQGRRNQGTLSKADMEEVAWEMGYENENYNAQLKPFEPLAKSLGANLRKEYDAGSVISKTASAKDGKKTGDSTGVGLFIPVPDLLAAQFPSLGAEDKSVPHVTFLYVGAVSKERTEEFISIVEEFFSGIPPVQAAFTGMDSFDNGDSRVVYSKVRFSGNLSQDHDRLKQRLLDMGFGVGHSFPIFQPHATLAYFDDPRAVYTGLVPEGSWVFNDIEIWGLPKLVTVPFMGPSESSEAKMARLMEKRAVSALMRSWPGR